MVTTTRHKIAQGHANGSVPGGNFDADLLSALRAVRRGDFSVRLPNGQTGINGEIAEAFNDVVELNEGLTGELRRISRAVGDGKTQERASLGTVRGSWLRSIESLNQISEDISRPRLEAIRVLTAVAQGDLSQRFRTQIEGERVRGESLTYARVVNAMVDELNEVTSELMRVAREVGTEGKLGGQANVRGLSGTWRDLTYSVNQMAGNLTAQVRNIADVTTAVANGDLSRKITVDVRGEIFELKNTINTMVDQLNAFASEVTRVAREVGSEGRLGGQANVPGVAGTWKDLTDSVNSMASNLTGQVRNIAEVTTAVANGDLSKKITVDVRGEILEVKNTVNTMVDQLNAFASEVTRVAREVGTEGKLGGQANVHGVEGTWRELTDSVNSMAGNLTSQVRNIAEVTTAVANGDLSKKITVDVRGEILELKNTVNTMVDQLNAFASEVTRVAREVGSEGILGGQADVHGVAGTWRELTDSVNSMASNLTGQVRNIAEVTTAVANGDLSKKITVDVRGEILEVKNTVNTMVDQLNAFASEVTRVAREVGTEGKLGGQANVRGVAGTWKDLTDSVNSMAGNLTAQVRNIADVTTAVANGDLSRKITVVVQGELLELKDTINTMVDQLNAFASEVTRVAREVGTEGKLGGQANVRGVAGTWRELTDSVNSMAGNLTGQVRNIADVTTAVANGDLSKKITVDVQGEILELKDTINTMVDQLNGFASEVTRVAREVGTEGKLGGQASVPGVAGTWKDLTDNVNSMAGNLTAQVRNIADVTTAVANGDLSKKITVDVQGEILELKYTINTMVDQLNAFASEVTRVAREVGSEGKLGGQADVRGVAGTWRELTDSVNSMAGNLTGQVRNIADVTTAVANGDLSRKITVDVRGEILELKNTINTMVDQLNAFASEVTRVAREVGSEGQLGGQANVPGVAGTWKDLTDSVNSMARNLTVEVRNIAAVTTAVASGDLSKKITVDVRGEILELKDTINTMVDQLNAFASEVTRVAREVGSEGRLGGQANVPGVAGTWKDLTDSVNSMASNLTGQVRNIATVTTAVANGDLSKKITVDVRGEILELKDTINTMVDQLNAFASEVTRVAREVGTEGKLGGQANVRGVAGTWRELTDSVNSMAGNLTEQVRGIARVVTAVANGDLKRKVTFEAKGEIAELAETINSMTDTLATFAEQVTSVAREVGIEGQLGGQANVPGAAGTWRDLTDNVNQLAANLTTQVRAIAGVATAVTSGDLSRSIEVAAQGEVEQLRDNINKMILNLRDTTQQNREQDWLKTNLARFSGMLQGQKDLQTVGRMILSELASVVGVVRGVFYFAEPAEGQPLLRLLASYAAEGEDHVPQRVAVGEGLIGQCAIERRRIVIENVPAGYAAIRSAIGATDPFNIVVLPVLFEGETKGVIELASFETFSETQFYFFDQLTDIIGIVLNTLVANNRTEHLLIQSQALTTELQQTNSELQEKALQLSEQNAEVERRRREIDEARAALEQKAEQLTQTSRYKSQFLANMSHELRTPLNSLLILSQQLSENPEGNLSERQVTFAKTIHAAGIDLLTLINDILDLSKIESGTTSLDIGRVRFEDIQEDVERNFRQVAQQKALDFSVRLASDLPPSLTTDPTRLQQILKNLLSNAFKFTETGFVRLSIEPAATGWSDSNESLNRARSVVAISVADSGVGISADKHSVIFEAFQQAEMDTSRRFGGTGLGLSISREIAALLGGEIGLRSSPGAGSTFTVYLPILYEPAVERLPAVNEPAALLAPVATTPSDGPTPPARTPEPGLSRTQLEDDLASIEDGDPVLLIVDDDEARIQKVRAAAHAKGYKALVALNSEEGLTLARRYLPRAVFANLGLAQLEGWRVLDLLKHDPQFRHVPVHVIGPAEEGRQAMRWGAASFAPPVVGKAASLSGIEALIDFAERPKRRLLIIEDSTVQLEALVQLLTGDDIEITGAESGTAALEALATGHFDCIVLDLGLPDIPGRELIGRIRTETGHEAVPIVIYTGKTLRRREMLELGQTADSVIVKDARSPERLLEETALHLHRPEAALSESQRRMLREIENADPFLEGRKVLIVDDDMRNIFALTSALERYGLEVSYAENGLDAIDRIHAQPRVDVVLMDIMMPEMDGFETMRRIREERDYGDLPIIALTAKAMVGDRERCLEAGASDYITKPVVVEQLLSLLRVNLQR